MATKSAKSLFGRYLGIDRNNRVWARNGIVAPTLRLGATEDSEALVDVEGLTTVTALSTATAAVATRGIASVTSGASTAYTLAAPPAAGVTKRFVATSTSTAVRQVTSAVPIIGGAAVGGDAGTISGSSNFTVMTFNGIGQVIDLLALSTAAWLNTNLRGFSTAATPLTTV